MQGQALTSANTSRISGCPITKPGTLSIMDRHYPLAALLLLLRVAAPLLLLLQQQQCLPLFHLPKVWNSILAICSIAVSAAVVGYHFLGQISSRRADTFLHMTISRCCCSPLQQTHGPALLPAAAPACQQLLTCPRGSVWPSSRHKPKHLCASYSGNSAALGSRYDPPALLPHETRTTADMPDAATIDSCTR